MKNRIFVLLLLVIVLLTSCEQAESVSENSQISFEVEEVTQVLGDTLRFGCSNLSENFNPFYSSTSADNDVISITSVKLLTFNSNQSVVNNAIDGENVIYDGVEYEYSGIANINSTVHLDGTETYEITLRKDVKFSDGTVLDVDDVIFSMYVLADPTYEGPSTFASLPIKGLEEYRHQYETLYELILSNIYIEDPHDNYGNLYSVEQAEFCCSAFRSAGINFARNIVDYSIANYSDIGVFDVASAALLRGYVLSENATVEDFWDAIFEKNSIDIEEISEEFVGVSFSELLNLEFGNREKEFRSKIKIINYVNKIEGIEKVDDYTLRIHLTCPDIEVYNKLSITVAPLHYYGIENLYNYDNNNFGFTKSDLSSIKDSELPPLGAGPYVFKTYSDGVIDFERNLLYYKGVPKTKYVKFIEMSETEKFSKLHSNECDIIETVLTSDIKTSIKLENGGVLSGEVFAVNNSLNYGYGYIGINADNVKVGDDKNSEASKNLRKAFATLFSVYRKNSILSYLGEDALIEYPLSDKSYIYPSINSDYKEAYAVDIDNEYIYKECTSDNERYECALNATIAFLKAAGFVFDENSNKFISAPYGAALSYNVIIPAEGNDNHPIYKILVDSKNALSKIGITLEISNPTDSNELWDVLNNNMCQMWVASWQFYTENPPLYRLYHSVYSVRYGLDDAVLDELIEQAISAEETEYRKNLYKECFERVQENAVEVPVYKNQDAIIYSTSRINERTLFVSDEVSIGWIENIHKIETNPVI